MARRQAIGRTVSGLVTVLGLTITVMAIPVETSRAGAEAWVRALSETERLQYSRAERIRKLPSDTGVRSREDCRRLRIGRNSGGTCLQHFAMAGSFLKHRKRHWVVRSH